MPYKNPEIARQKAKEYREKNVEKEKIRHKLYYENNKEKFKEYAEKNKERKKETFRKYRQTPEGKKKTCIYRWKSRGLVGDYDMIYDRYLNTTNCDECNCILTKKCMDHSHITGEFRNVLCNRCNTIRGYNDRNKNN